MSWRRYPATPQPRLIHSVPDEEYIRAFRGMFYGVLLSLPCWVAIAWVGQIFWNWLGR